MVSIRVFCCLLMILVLQLHAQVFNANFNSQAPPQRENSEGLGESTSPQITNTPAEAVITNRKTLKHVNVKVEAKEKNSLEVESKETVRKRKNKKRLAETTSLTADYSNPGHHPPRHN